MEIDSELLGDAVLTECPRVLRRGDLVSALRRKGGRPTSYDDVGVNQRSLSGPMSEIAVPCTATDPCSVRAVRVGLSLLKN